MGKRQYRLFNQIKMSAIKGVLYNDIFVFLLLFDSLLSIFCISFRMPTSVLSVLFYTSFFLVFLWFVVDSLKTKHLFRLFSSKQKIKYKSIAFYILIIGICLYIISILTTCTSVSNLTFSYLKKPIITIGCLVAFYLFFYNDVSNVIKTLFCFFCFLSSSVLIFSFVLISSGRFWNGNYLILNFENPNALGLIAGSLMLCNLVCYFYTNKKMIKILYVIISLVCLFFTLLTKSRNSIASIILVCVSLFIYKKSKVKNKPLCFSYAITFLPLIILVLYVSLFSNQGFSSFVKKFEFVGKSLSSRTLGWFTGYRLFGKSILFGNFKLAADGSSYLPGFLNFYLDWLVEGGIIPFIFFLAFIFLSLYVKFINLNKNRMVSVVALFSGVYILFSSIFESGFFFGLHGLFVIPLCCVFFSTKNDCAFVRKEKLFCEVNI